MGMSKVIFDNCDQVTNVQRAMFDIPDPFLNPRVPCNALPEINLELWKERVACNVGGTTIQTGDAKRVSPCTMCTCTKEGPLCQSLKVENCFHLAQSFTQALFWTITFVRSNVLSRLEPSQMFVQVKIELGLASHHTTKVLLLQSILPCYVVICTNFDEKY